MYNKYVVVVFFKTTLNNWLFFDKYRYNVEEKIIYWYNKKFVIKKMLKYLKKDFDIQEEFIFSIKVYLLK